MFMRFAVRVVEMQRVLCSRGRRNNNDDGFGDKRSFIIQNIHFIIIYIIVQRYKQAKKSHSSTRVATVYLVFTRP